MHNSYRVFTLFFFAIIIRFTFLNAQTTINTDTINLQNGDILFQDLDCGPFCDAVEEVTFGINNTNLSHVGIIMIKADSIFVIEAVSKGVCITPLSNFLYRTVDKEGKPKVIVGRLIDEYQSLIPQAILETQKLIGKPYDDVFDINNDKYYCSELIYFVFYRANNNNALFELQPMTYISPKTGKTYEIWVNYFKSLNISIPESKMGINPGTISRSQHIDIFYPFGKPDGLNDN